MRTRPSGLTTMCNGKCHMAKGKGGAKRCKCWCEGLYHGPDGAPMRATFAANFGLEMTEAEKLRDLCHQVPMLKGRFEEVFAAALMATAKAGVDASPDATAAEVKANMAKFSIDDDVARLVAEDDLESDPWGEEE